MNKKVPLLTAMCGAILVIIAATYVYKNNTVNNKTSLLTYKGKEWTLSKVILADGSTLLPKGKIPFTFTLKEDMTLHGAADCNGYFGAPVVINGNIVKMSVLATTKIGCGDSEGNAKFTTYLEKAVSYKIQSDTLIFETFDKSQLFFILN